MDLLALAVAREFRDVDAAGAVATLDAFGAELVQAAAETGGAPEAGRTCVRPAVGGKTRFLR